MRLHAILREDEDIERIKFIAPTVYLDGLPVYTATDEDELEFLSDAEIWVGPDFVQGGDKYGRVVLYGDNIVGMKVYKATDNRAPVQYPYFTYEFPSDIAKYLPGGHYSHGFGGSQIAEFVVNRLERVHDLEIVHSENLGPIVVLPGAPAIFMLDEGDGDNIETIVLQKCEANFLTPEEYKKICELEH